MDSGNRSDGLNPGPAAGGDAAADRRPVVGADPIAAAEVLRRGGLVAMPTETVYGLGADAADPVAVARIFTVKGRPRGHPLIVHLGRSADLARWAADVPPAAERLAAAFWPGPLTIVVARSAVVPDEVTGGRPTVALRVPDHPMALVLLEAFGGGVAAPSANRFGRVSPTTAADVVSDLGTDVDYVLDGGACRVGVESTIVDLSGAEPELLRPGGIGEEQLSEVLGCPVRRWAGASPARAPGMLATHYAPRAEVQVVVESEVMARAASLSAAGRRVAVLAPRVVAGVADSEPIEVIELEPAGSPADYARVLYARLRQADRLGADVVLAVAPEEDGVGRAVIDRLRRAAHPRAPSGG